MDNFKFQLNEQIPTRHIHCSRKERNVSHSKRLIWPLSGSLLVSGPSNIACWIYFTLEFIFTQISEFSDLFCKEITNNLNVLMSIHSLRIFAIPNIKVYVVKLGRRFLKFLTRVFRYRSYLICNTILLPEPPTTTNARMTHTDHTHVLDWK